jgi:hypothetical protein
VHTSIINVICEIGIRVLAAVDWRRPPVEPDLMQAANRSYESRAFLLGYGRLRGRRTMVAVPHHTGMTPVNGARLGAGGCGGTVELIVIDGNCCVGGIAESVKSHTPTSYASMYHTAKVQFPKKAEDKIRRSM